MFNVERGEQKNYCLKEKEKYLNCQFSQFYLVALQQFIETFPFCKFFFIVAKVAYIVANHVYPTFHIVSYTRTHSGLIINNIHL